QIRASSDSGGSALLQCSQVGRSSSMTNAEVVQGARWVHLVARNSRQLAPKRTGENAAPPHARGGMGARERPPQAANSASATRRKLNGVFAASPREKWKTIADAWSATHPSAASTVSPGLMRVRDGNSTPSPPRRSNTAVAYRKLGDTWPIHGIFEA